ncbi:MAG: hypothetical protein JAY75_14960, partial [Candidatus Thiodiazotropha taylori]|nr:hypothetical protein [Candidatus Thiodiazotropha taylori]MCW4309515.1 hypothetical protein [Candidatus Thiodiazotropha endolucinida]
RLIFLWKVAKTRLDGCKQIIFFPDSAEARTYFPFTHAQRIQYTAKHLTDCFASARARSGEHLRSEGGHASARRARALLNAPVVVRVVWFVILILNTF